MAIWQVPKGRGGFVLCALFLWEEETAWLLLGGPGRTVPTRLEQRSRKQAPCAMALHGLKLPISAAR